MTATLAPVANAVADDALELLPSGKVRARMEGTTHTLRRPRLGELRALREDLNERVKAATEALKAATEANGDALLVDATADVIAWVRLAFGVLSDKTLPEDDDDLPAWVVGISPADLIAHWRAVPLVRGAA